MFVGLMDNIRISGKTGPRRQSSKIPAVLPPPMLIGSASDPEIFLYASSSFFISGLEGSTKAVSCPVDKNLAQVFLPIF